MSSKEKYWSKQGKMESYDVVVIGSGMGGMTSAALLSKLGKRVLVLEQHYLPGGFTHIFRRKGYKWDVGVHAVGEVTQHSMPGRLLSNLTDDRLKWASLGSPYEEFYYPNGFRFDFPDNPIEFKRKLIDEFPSEKGGVERYFEMIKDVSRAMKGYYLARLSPKGISTLADFILARKAQPYFSKTTDEVIGSLTQDERLKTILSAQWGYYGSLPKDSAFAMQALVIKHFWHGGYYPIGGSEQIAIELLRTVADAGGWTRIKANVQEINVTNNRVNGVKLDTGETISCKTVISAVGIMSTLNRLLPADYKQEWVSKALTNIRPAPAHVCLYLGFKGDIRENGASSANKWFWNKWTNHEREWHINQHEDLSDCPILYCSFPSLKDPNHDPGPEMRHTGEVVTFVPWHEFKTWEGSRWKKRNDDYDALKKKIKDKMLSQFLKHMPELESKLDYAELSTPLSTQHFCRPMEGSIYGIEPTPQRFQNKWLRPQSPIKGLYFSGSEVASVGVIGAMMGGVLGAAAVQPKAALSYIQKATLKR